MASFRLLGIPVQVDPWFVLGLFFVFQISGGERVGLFAAVAIGVLTLLHELGHALTARSFGCEVSVRLNLFVGWASYSSSRPLRRAEQILISLMGPLTQLGVTLVAMGAVHRFFQARQGDPSLLFDLWQGLSWAGVVIALLNLLPLWPLDGGHVVHQVLRRFLPDPVALRAVLFTTVAGLVVLVGLGIAAGSGDGGLAQARLDGPVEAAEAILDPSTVGALWTQVATFPAHLLRLPWLLVVFSGIGTLQALQTLRGPRRREVPAVPIDLLSADGSAVNAELTGWERGTVPDFPRGWGASPWLRAHVELRRGDTACADAALAQVTAGGRRWILPDPARPELAPLVARLGPRPAVGDLSPSLVLLRVLGHHGEPEALLHAATAVYQQHRSVEALMIAAAALARRGHPDDAVRWLGRAMAEAPDLHRLTTDPAFLPLHARADFRELVRTVSGRL